MDQSDCSDKETDQSEPIEYFRMMVDRFFEINPNSTVNHVLKNG